MTGSPHRVRRRLARLPDWTAHPGFGVAALFAVAVLLIVHGEPQPSSRPSGKSIVVSGSPTAPAGLPATLVVRADTLEYRAAGVVRKITLPDLARPRSVLTNRGLSVGLAVIGDRQQAYAVSRDLTITDLGYADAVLPASQPGSSVLVEAALADPCRITSPGPSATASAGSTSDSASSTSAGRAPLRDFSVRRFNSSAKQVGSTTYLPAGMRAATDSVVGLVVWQPVNQPFDGVVPLEPLSAAATLIRPNGTYRQLGPVYPLASTAQNLLVWDVQRRQFGIMLLTNVTSTATSTASPTGSGSRTPSAGASGRTESGSTSAKPTPTPTAVLGTRYFNPTRGFTVTGPATFAPDGSAFAVYAQVGSRRRLVVAQVSAVLSDQIEVLALAVNTVSPSPAASASTTRSSSTAGTSTSQTSSDQTSSDQTSAVTTSTGPSSSAPTFEPDGFPVPAPLQPLWWADQVVAVGSEGSVVGYRPGSDQASLFDLGFSDIQSLAEAP
ncbi:hypothetical protein BH10ACT8_BH10ACT8_17860 [soil metagenome]